MRHLREFLLWPKIMNLSEQGVKMKNHLLISSLSIVLFMGCGTPQIGERLYKSSETGQSQTLTRCRVLSVEEVAVYDEQAVKTGANIGKLYGGIVGKKAAEDLGGDSGKDLKGITGAILGGVSGNYLGEKTGQEISKKPGARYHIVLTNGTEKILVQEVAREDRILQSGEECVLVHAKRGQKERVLAPGATGAVKKPEGIKWE